MIMIMLRRVLDVIVFILAVWDEMYVNVFNRRVRFKDSKLVAVKGKVVVITGANTGVGKVTAKELARRGANVIIGCRDIAKGNKAIEDIKSEYKDVDIRLIRLDLSSLASVRQFAEQVCEQESHIDILINNAGVAFHPKARTEDGFEMHFGANYLGHFLLTHLLLKLLTAAPKARIVNASSVMYLMGKINFDDINSDTKYSAWKAYAQSKLAIVLFTRELARKLSHTNITTYCLYPGCVRTDRTRHLVKQSSRITRFLIDIIDIFMIDADLGAQTTLYCALEPSLSDESGHYYSDSTRVLDNDGTDDVTADRLWQLSNEFVRLEKHRIL